MLPDEICLMWRHKLTGAKVLFLLNRYLFIASYAAQIMFDFTLETSHIVSTGA